MEISYILQIVTISITLIFGIITYLQTKQIQHSQNIVSVTTNYRLTRSEQLKEAGVDLLTNTTPEILEMCRNPEEMLTKATRAYEKIGIIMHRNFEADKLLISLAENIRDAAFEYVKKGYQQAEKIRLEYLQKVFRLRCDMYSSAEWNRVKRETVGRDTTSQSWIDYYGGIEKKFDAEIVELRKEYGVKSEE
ncbi:MAG: hypothetical protein IJB69_00810 [Clostridia bacterium]|nr:hypothetical protein [Clostridia bacterium]